MIDNITGTIQIKQPHRVVIECGGLGIEVLVPLSTCSKLPEKGSKASLLTILNWRPNDGPQLIGFNNEDERQIFLSLTGVNKVGPKMALNIMSASTPEALAAMILNEDIKGLTSIKGVGSKLASRLVLELKEKIAKLGIGSIEPTEKPSESSKIPFESDVREALASLGYTTKEITASLKKVADELPPDSSLEDTVSAVLRSFSR